MAVEAYIAAVSLVVSFTAMLVASGQLVQALIATAEGYRRCAPSVIGAWAKLRHRRWNWVEFRFEVEYATPHLMVLSPSSSDWGVAQSIYGETYDLASLSELGSRRNIIHHQVLEETVKLGVFKTMGASAYRWERYIPRDEVRVTWLQLIGEIHRTCNAFWPNKSRQILYELGSTHAAIAIRRWNWDFMPMDLVKPLATSTLNNVILLALRLNMQWRVLDQQSGIFQADGNGYSLTSSQVRGLGITFTFNTIGKQDIDRRCAPSEAVDKMLFGIIPGSKPLVGRDFLLVGRNREVNFEALFEEIGVKDRQLREELATTVTIEHRNDLIILLSTFLPIQSSPVVYNYFPGWRDREVLSPFHYFEGRMGYVDSLEDRLHSMSKYKAKTDMEQVLKKFNELRQNWKYDFYDYYEHSAIEGDDGQRKIELVKTCSDIFAWTTKYFQGKTGTQQRLEQDNEKTLDWSEYHGGRTRYVDLVAGHSIMTKNVAQLVWSNLKEHTKFYPGGDSKREEHKAIVTWNEEEPGMHYQYHFARQYAAHLNHEQYGIVHYLHSKGLNWHEDYIEAAWWVLVLRGIVWDMSTTGDMRWKQRPYHWTTDFVPSAFYDIRTPVWIT